MKHAAYSLLFAVLISFFTTGCESREDKIKDAVSTSLQNHRQQIFDAFHPIGTAKYIKVHSIEVYGNNVDAVFTIYWQGPITTDGYTKVAMHYDGDVERWTAAQILATNGMTNSQAGELAFDFGYEIGSALGNNR